MSIPTESLQVGRCYLSNTGHVRRVLALLPGDRVQFEYRLAAVARAFGWRSNAISFEAFKLTTLREVPCDWTPGTAGARP